MSATSQRLFSFVAAERGLWQVQRHINRTGVPLPLAARLSVLPGADTDAQSMPVWQLQGVTSNERYVTRNEKTALAAQQADLGRPAATCAALIALRKNVAWWALTQDERRAIIEAQSNHIAIGMRYLPAIARRLYHCRDLATEQPFDFVTWFEFAPADSAAFDELLAQLRGSVEWQFVDREVDIRLMQEGSA